MPRFFGGNEMELMTAVMAKTGPIHPDLMGPKVVPSASLPTINYCRRCITVRSLLPHAAHIDCDNPMEVPIPALRRSRALPVQSVKGRIRETAFWRTECNYSLHSKVQVCLGNST